MEKILADTSAWIAGFYRTGHSALQETMRQKILSGELVLTGIVLFELLQGAKNESDYESLHKKLSILPFLSATDSDWSQAAKLAMTLRKKGVKTSLPDVFIARLAMTHACTLLHCDSDFEQIAKRTNLKTISFA